MVLTSFDICFADQVTAYLARVVLELGPVAALVNHGADLKALARQGELPPPQDFSAATHTRFRAKLEGLVALAEKGDVDGFRAVTINPVSSSPKAIARHRDLAIIAIDGWKVGHEKHPLLQAGRAFLTITCDLVTQNRFTVRRRNRHYGPGTRIWAFMDIANCPVETGASPVGQVTRPFCTYTQIPDLRTQKPVNNVYQRSTD